MRKNDFAGWREVFSFTFSQTVKQKAYVIFLVVFSVIALFYSTVSSLYKQYVDRKDEKAAVSELIVFDETGLQIDYSNAFTSKKFRSVSVIATPDKSFEEYEKQMEEHEDDTMLVKITFDKEEKLYHMLFVQGKKVYLSELAGAEFAGEFCDFFDEAKMKAISISEEQLDFIQTDISREVKLLSETGEITEKEKSDSITMNDYFIMLALLTICMMLINISGNQIALSIVTEKSSRVLEYLVLNVRPLALITGKLLATIVTSSLQMITVGFCYIASPLISNLITPHLADFLFGAAEATDMSSTVADETLATSIQMINGIKIEFIFLAFLFVILGIVFYGIIAGLLGAAVSKMDEMQETMSMFQLLLIVGCYADLALCIMQMNGTANPWLVRVLSVCPVSSPFWVPGSMLLGKMSWPLIFVSFLLMIVAIILLFKLTASVYEAMIFYNGKALKVKDILALASSKKKSVRKEEVIGEE